MKKNRSLCLLAAVTVLLAAACKEEPKQADSDKNHLSTSLVNNNATAGGFPETAPMADAVMSFDDTTFNFGSISEGEVVTHDFTFRNTGNEPLLISNAHASCGCTIPQFPRDPVAPGATASIKVSFNSQGKKGHNEKTITINTNSNRGNNNLYITANVN